MLLAVPVSQLQVWAFFALSIVFFLFLLRAFSRRTRETGVKSDRRSRLGIVLQSVGIGIAGIGPQHPVLAAMSVLSLLGTAAVFVMMSAAIYLFAASSRALGKNWSLVARTRSDHELVRDGPYAWIRHPIYLGMLFFLLGLAVPLGHWAQLLIAVPIFLFGTQVRTRIEDDLLEQSFGDTFREYRNSTPSLFPKIV